MSQTLILELNDQFFAAIHQQAESIGIPAENLAVKLLQQNFSQMFNILPTDAEKTIRRAKFERHFGAIDLEIDINLDNDSIDADLAKESAVKKSLNGQP
jgi:hypothetical protein